MDFGVNQALVEELYQRYRDNPQAVDEAWRQFFQQLGETPPCAVFPEYFGLNGRATNGSGGTPLAPPGHGTGGSVGSQIIGAPGSGVTPLATVRPPHTNRGARLSPPPPGGVMNELQDRVSAMINAYRVRGHLFADLDPLGIRQLPPDELSLEAFGLDRVPGQTSFATGGFGTDAKLPLGEIVQRLRETYCRHIGVEFTYIDEPDMREWLQQRMESSCNRVQLSREGQVRVLSKLIDAEVFEQFLHTNYIGAKRFSLEGAETLIPLMDVLIEQAGNHGVDEIVIGMAHRGRLNVLVNVLEKSLQEVFASFEDKSAELQVGRGDVKYHLGYSSNRTTAQGRDVHLTLAFNPSHLEWVNPVVEGRVRAKQDRRGDERRGKVVPMLVHGDAAFIGQGIVAETLNLSNLEGYRTGGTVHIVVNNQIGFTTATHDSRSSRYCTDITRMLRCPVFHVNGEDPEAVVQAAQLAIEFRTRYQRDVVIDVYCYRRYGHNEADEPRFTQPLMYAAIDAKVSVREVYIQALAASGEITSERAAQLAEARRATLEHALKSTREGQVQPKSQTMAGLWRLYRGGRIDGVPDLVGTQVDKRTLSKLMTRLSEVPDDFNLHPKLRRLLDQRLAMRDGKKRLDWGAAETLAYATLLDGGVWVRLSGQDVRRGTFSHRHSVFYDLKQARMYSPLAHLRPNQGRFEVWDSPLSEAGVLGFEYGYSLDRPDGLVIWEAQFGDFANSAQVIIDQFVTSSEEKWNRLSGLVMLLPHGFEGQGPEHSSARLERFLTMCAADNIQVCNLTTPAQLFHCLRRQVIRPVRKPLVIMSPKSLLRHPEAASTLDELAKGSFQPLIKDRAVRNKQVKKILMCAGKIYFPLAQARKEAGRDDVAIVRLEQLYPLSPKPIKRLLSSYPSGTPLVWVQEEPANMGAWYFLNHNLRALVEPRNPLSLVSRQESASPATGSMGAHQLEHKKLLQDAFR